MKKVLINFILNCYLVQLVVLFSALSITFLYIFFCPIGSYSRSKKLVLDRIFYSVTSIWVYTISNNFVFDDTVWKSKKSSKILLEFLKICPTVCSKIITATAYLSCSYPYSYAKYKLLSPTFSIHIFTYRWYPRNLINCFSFYQQHFLQRFWNEKKNFHSLSHGKTITDTNSLLNFY